MDKHLSNLSPAKKALLEKLKAGKFQADTIPKRQISHNIPLSFSQQRLWFIDQLYHGSSFYNIPIAFHIKGYLNITALRQSLNEILKRHEIWRTTFKLINGEPVQEITPNLIWDLPIINLQHLSNHNWESQVKEFVAKEAAKPFNLAKELLVKATLLHLNEQEHVLLITMHHIITDGWSCGVFLRELSTLYAAFSTNQPSPLPELPIQYADFAIWQRDRIQGEFLATKLKYWKQQLSGELPVLQLPTDRPRPSVTTFAGAKQYFTFSTTLTNALKQLSKQEDATLFMTLLAAFNILLNRYTDQEDILIGSPIANRNRTELEGMLGLFVNTLVLRNNLSGNPRFSEFLHRVRQVTLDAYAHQDLPFEMLVEELQPERDLSRNPLYEVMFVLQNTPTNVQEVSGLTLRTLDFDSGTSQLDIFLSMFESQEGLTGCLEYNTDIFDTTTISQFIKNYQTLLENIVLNPQQHICELSLLTASEQEQLLIKYNQTSAEYKNLSLNQLFEKQVELTPDSIALIHQSQQITYRQLNDKVNQLANYLQKQGVTKETLIAICLERSIDMIVGILAILKAGGAYIPLEPSYPVERLNFMLSDSQASILISNQEILEKLSLSLPKIICLDIQKDEIAQQSPQNTINISQLDNLAYIIYTSGSTGQPKGVLGTHRGTVNGLHWLWKTYPFTPEEVCCQKTAISFVDSVWEIFAPLLQGIPTVIISNATLLDPQLFIEVLAHQKVTRIILVPSLLRLLLENYHHLTKKLSQLKLWITSGEALSINLAKTFRDAMPFAKLINLYGSSEVSANATYYDISLLQNQANTVPIGRPIDNTQTYVLNRNLQPTPLGVIGELYIGGDGLARGYLHRPELTQERFIDNPFIPETKLYKTGDLVRYLSDGNLQYFGRDDAQVKIRGFRVELGEITSVINRHPEVQDAVVIAVNDAEENQRLIAYIVTEKQDITAQLLVYLQQKLPSYMLPSAFVVLDALPLTPNGKVDKYSLPRDTVIQVNTTKTLITPRNFTELSLVKLWENLLNTSPIGVTDNFFNLGGHSFLAVRLMAQIQDRFGHNLSLSTLFENPTIEKLAAIVSQPFRESSNSPVVAINSSDSKLPFFCIHGAGGGINHYINLSRRLGEDYPFYALEHNPDTEEPEIISVEETASYYLQEIRKIQPNGPYLLGGHCYGGVLAFEMAQQLQKQGERVDLLVVIDAILAETRIESTKDDDAKFLLRMAESIKTDSNIDFAVSFEELRDLSLSQQIDLINQKANFIFTDTEIKDFIRYYQLFKAHVQAMRNYVPLVYPESMTLLRAKEEIIHDFESPEFHTDDPLLGWRKYSIQPIKVIEIPGDHFSIFVEPHIQELAKTLRVCIDNAVSNLNNGSKNN
ncbi:non-ribosomal peptide synthetase [Nostoc linckia z18]|uniref:Non-ribosomal peptide synthetase n=2 Tax=Nostoc linckia TaxID=92942 RepID=A0A9Q5ZDR4_NOSLI|nr:non-ribosomal peptide synthetase [Nostoc linckia]PHK28283.1 non-ribosomal peptide synthetase [Nostoc linckia z15]PHK47336.1 non-ribosomal peptide synthetase [Nostoc linckia z16]PHJ65684.1 non-ribosomal peptide synthetase [Nostoc linckia z1]PHJ70478.1 non-ribosomal peptide synthetase [Nostoc linckia z3]PHJ75546.1 non-ribosomal peptide synthetase [Nostoc linckia z2]